jgi:hypothetical protein
MIISLRRFISVAAESGARPAQTRKNTRIKRVRRAAEVFAFTTAATVGFGVLTALPVNADGYDSKRPVYAIAHGVNDLESLDRALAAGANGVELHPSRTA